MSMNYTVKTIIVNYCITQLVHCSQEFFDLYVFFLYGTCHNSFFCENVRLLLASASSELRFYIKCGGDCFIRIFCSLYIQLVRVFVNKTLTTVSKP